MISTIVTKEKQPKKPEYPCLKQSINSKKIVLFKEARKGTVVFNAKQITSDCASVGAFAPDWIMDNFIPFKGELLLKND